MTHRPLLYLLPALFVAITSASELHANDITITNPTLTGTNTVNGTTQVQFDITWANSWRTSSAPNNRDAAWVFVKYRHATTGEWNHARLGSDAQHSAPAGSTIATGLLTPGSGYDAATNWGVGAFIHRSADGTGTFTANGVELRWNYAGNGIAYGDIAEVKVFAVEMVYVPQGSFSVGDRTNNMATNRGNFRNPATANPLAITSEAALTLGGTANGNLASINTNVPNDDFNFSTTKTLPAAFPKGFAGFYLMKYEITQQQYVDFLNTLTRTQQNTRTATDISGTAITNRYVMSNSSTLSFRNGIRCDGTVDANASITFYCDLNGNGTGGEATDGQWVACNYLSWADVAAYLDWSGLRPMTELEYEKACRGPVTPVADEYAWGSLSITGAANITNGGAINESSNTAGARAVYNGNANVQGPMRVGVFAAGATSRAQSGAGYYGAMELSGNLWEQAVTVGNATGRDFTGTLGNGALNATGGADAANWPGTSAGLRGGSWNMSWPLCVSNRILASNISGDRDFEVGGRGVRLFP